MATLSSRGDSFKTFLAEKKAEYRSKFPFLTESQVVAKLKRVWNNQQARDTRATAVKCKLALCKLCLHEKRLFIYAWPWGTVDIS